MRLDGRGRNGVRGMLMNAETSKPIRWVRWAEIPEDPLAQGDFEAFRMNPEEAKSRGIPLSEIVYRGRCRMRFIPAAPRIGIKPTSQRDLSGSLDDARKRLVEPKLLIPGEECEEPGCHRLASWKVSTEQLIEPERDAEGRLHERGITIRVYAFCDKHYRNPTVFSLRGVESEVEVEARPQ